MVPLKLSKLADRFLCVFFDEQCTQDVEELDVSFEHIPDLVRVQQNYSKSEAVDDLSVDCKQLGEHVHMF